MAFLAGDQTNHTQARGLTQDVARYMTDGYVAAASGSCTAVFCKCDNWAGLTTSRIKAIVFNSGGSQIGISDEITVPATTPSVATAAFGTPFAITSGQTYYIALICNNGTAEVYDDNNTFNSTDCGGTYSFASPAGATFSGSGNASGRPNVYLDGTGSGVEIAPGLGSVPQTGRAPGLGFGINMPDVP